MIHSIVQMGYLISGIGFILGLKMMSSPQKAVRGNFIAASGMILAVVLTIIYCLYVQPVIPYVSLLTVAVAIALGTIVGYLISYKVQMTAMPQMVSLFNAMGGGSAMLIGWMELQHGVQLAGTWIILSAGAMIGAVSFSGSGIAYLKLSGKKVEAANYGVRTLGFFLPLLLAGGMLIGHSWFSSQAIAITVLIGIALVYGVIFVLPIGGADMPVVISLLNSFTGMAAGLAGIAYQNKVMIIGGILVGAAGLLLTLLMCKAMNRSIMNVLLGAFKKENKKSKGDVGNLGVIQETDASEVALNLAYAGKVAIIPGYGLAVAQAQHACHQLEKMLEEHGVETIYVIHPVPGRMPGHMNVLLAEADVSYEKLIEMDEVNDQMDAFDVVIVIGANDVVNPAAEQNSSSKIYGMPIIRAHRAKSVVVIKRSMNAGYAGIENELFHLPNCKMLFADAKKGLNDIATAMKKF